MRNKRKHLTLNAKLTIVFWVLFAVTFGGSIIGSAVEVNTQNDSALYGRSYSYSENNIFVKMLTALDNCKGE